MQVLRGVYINDRPFSNNHVYTALKIIFSISLKFKSSFSHRALHTFPLSHLIFVTASIKPRADKSRANIHEYYCCLCSNLHKNNFAD